MVGFLWELHLWDFILTVSWQCSLQYCIYHSDMLLSFSEMFNIMLMDVRRMWQGVANITAALKRTQPRFFSHNNKEQRSLWIEGWGRVIHISWEVWDHKYVLHWAKKNRFCFSLLLQVIINVLFCRCIHSCLQSRSEEVYDFLTAYIWYSRSFGYYFW